MSANSYTKNFHLVFAYARSAFKYRAIFGGRSLTKIEKRINLVLQDKMCFAS